MNVSVVLSSFQSEIWIFNSRYSNYRKIIKKNYTVLSSWWIHFNIKCLFHGYIFGVYFLGIFCEENSASFPIYDFVISFFKWHKRYIIKLFNSTMNSFQISRFNGDSGWWKIQYENTQRWFIFIYNMLSVYFEAFLHSIQLFPALFSFLDRRYYSVYSHELCYIWEFIGIWYVTKSINNLSLTCKVE